MGTVCGGRRQAMIPEAEILGRDSCSCSKHTTYEEGKEALVLSIPGPQNTTTHIHPCHINQSLAMPRLPRPLQAVIPKREVDCNIT